MKEGILCPLESLVDIKETQCSEVWSDRE